MWPEARPSVDGLFVPPPGRVAAKRRVQKSHVEVENFPELEEKDVSDISGYEEKYIAAATEVKKKREQQQKRFLWEQKLRQLRHRIQILENEKRAASYNPSNACRKFIIDLERLDTTNTADFKVSQSDMFDRISNVQWAVRKMASHIALMGQGQRYLEKLKELMEGAEAAITVFKRENRPRFEMLLNQELLLTQEVDAFNDTLRDMGLKAKASHSTKRKNIQLPSQPSGRQIQQKQRQDQAVLSMDIKKVISNIDAEIADAGGSTGGWDPRDHTAFLRIVSRNKVTAEQWRRVESGASIESITSVSAVVSRAVDDIPTQTQRSILSHARWYARYTCLLAQKKQAVQAWRNGKVSREQSQRIQRESNRKVRDAESRGRAEKRLREAKIRQRRDAEEKRQAVEEWRREKEARMREEREREEAERKQKHEKLLQQTERRQRQKDAVARYKLEKASEAAQRRTMKASQERKNDSEDAIRLQERRDRDMEYAKRKRAAVLKAKEKETRRERFLDSYKTSTARRAPKARSDPRRLIGDTAASRAQRLGNDELERLVERRHTQVAHARTVASTGRIARGAKSYGIGMGVKVAGRKVPSWRAGV